MFCTGHLPVVCTQAILVSQFCVLNSINIKYKKQKSIQKNYQAHQHIVIHTLISVMYLI